MPVSMSQTELWLFTVALLAFGVMIGLPLGAAWQIGRDQHRAWLAAGGPSLVDEAEHDLAALADYVAKMTRKDDSA